MKSTRWAALPVLAILAACGADGGSSGTGISTIEGNVASVDAAAGAAIEGVTVSIEGSEAAGRTDRAGRFRVRGDFEGDLTVVFAGPAASVQGRAMVNVPPEGTLTLGDVRIDTSAGLATADSQRVDCEGVIVEVDCTAQRLRMVSPRGALDTDRYTVRLDGASVHDAAGRAIACDELELGDEIRVRAAVEDDGSFGEADVEVRR